jgi:hypothetical protein
VREETVAATAKPAMIGGGTANILENCPNSSPRHRTARHLYPHTVTANAALTNAVHTTNPELHRKLKIHSFICIFICVLRTLNSTRETRTGRDR